MANGARPGVYASRLAATLHHFSETTQWRSMIALQFVERKELRSFCDKARLVIGLVKPADTTI
jgi:hypothetical protein